jgi:hypothetical protein
MAVPRFHLRTLVVAIAIVAFLLAVGMLTLENARLQRVAAIERQRAMAAEARERATFEYARRSLLDLAGTTLPPPPKPK